MNVGVPFPLLSVTEPDGTPLVRGVRTLRFSNGTVTDDGSGMVTVSVTTTPGGSSGQFQVNDGAGGFAGTARVAYATSGNIINVTAGAATDQHLRLTCAASHSGAPFQIRKSNGTTVLAEARLFDSDNATFNASTYTTPLENFEFNCRSTAALCSLNSSGVFGWSLANEAWQTKDVDLRRVSAAVLALTDGDQTNDPTLMFRARSSTTNQQERAALAATDIDNTHAIRKYGLVCTVSDFNAAREAWRAGTDGTYGYLIQAAHPGAFADALLPNGSLILYDDGAGSLAIKLKDSGGTVRTATVPLT